MRQHYELIEERPIQELNGTGYLLEHTNSGARIFVIKNDDDNKTFSITFRTPPMDDTGLPHILEHSVLCGSRKFPVKDPFVELAKGSLNTFLNAMTFSDKTMYPVASMNDKDFENLMDVYLDAVLYPNIHKDPMILKQEGWHYELKDQDEPIIFKGVVYNEMKGAFSSPEQILFRKIQQSLFPDNAYGFESGGDPDAIPQLTQEQFLDFHKTYYHPSNSYIFLYGNLDIDQKLEWLHDHYLSDFERIEVDSSLKEQAPFQSPEVFEMNYPIASNENTEGKAYFSMNFVTEKNPDKVAYLALDILEYLLLEVPGAVLKEALLAKGLGKDVFGTADNGILQPTFSVIAKHVDASRRDEFVSVIQAVFKDISERGFEKKQLQAAINYFEFKTKEADFGRYPRGVFYAMKAMDTWLYDRSPFEHFGYNAAFEALKAGITTGYMENLVKQYFVDNTHVSILVLEPDTSLLERREAEVASDLDNYKRALSKTDLEALIEATNALEAYQSEPETKEAIDTIPLLAIEDVDEKAMVLDIEQEAFNGQVLLQHHTFTNDIVYVKWLFDLSGLKGMQWAYAKLLSGLLGKMRTKNYTYGQLADEINLHTGGISVKVDTYGDGDDANRCYPKLEVSAKAFVHKREELIRLVEEIILSTQLEDLNRLKELVQEMKSRMQMTLSGSGHAMSATRALSYCSVAGKIKDTFDGIGFYEALNLIEERLSIEPEGLVAELKDLLSQVVMGENLVVGMTLEVENKTTMTDLLKQHLVRVFPGALTDQPLNSPHVAVKKLNEGFMTSDKIQFVAKAGNFKQAGFNYHGSMKVLQSIVSLDYLWTNIRIKGGAYGAMASFGRNGDLYFVSYRDPNLVKTFHHYDMMCDFIENLDLSERELRKYILGTISTMDQPLTPAMKNDRALRQYVTGVTAEMIQITRDEILVTDNEALRSFSRMVQQVMAQNNLCVVGNEHKLKEEKDVFMSVKHVNA